MKGQVKIKPSSRKAQARAVSIKTVSYGFMGQQSYEGVEKVDKN